MQSGRGDTNQLIPLGYFGTVQDLRFVHHTHDAADQIDVPAGINIRHLAHFSADQRATVLDTSIGDPFDHLLDLVGVHVSEGYVVKEEERPCPLDQDVIDTMVDDIDPDRVKPIASDRDLRFGSNRIDARHQNGLSLWESRKVEHPAEEPDFG